MPHIFTAIIRLRQQGAAQFKVQSALCSVPGVNDVHYDPRDSRVTLNFDSTQTGLSELVRIIEGLGVNVTGIAQRQRRLRPAP